MYRVISIGYYINQDGVFVRTYDSTLAAALWLLFVEHVVSLRATFVYCWTVFSQSFLCLCCNNKILQHNLFRHLKKMNGIAVGRSKIMQDPMIINHLIILFLTRNVRWPYHLQKILHLPPFSLVFWFNISRFLPVGTYKRKDFYENSAQNLDELKRNVKTDINTKLI